MAGLLGALLSNESGGRNIANTTQGTSSGQAQGYFQITTGTWNDFGGQKYAANPLAASYEQQAEVASRIPLRRWDESTIAKMRATGIPIDPNRTLGENLAANGESFAGGAADSGGAVASYSGVAGTPRDDAARQAMADALAMRADALAETPKSQLADTLASSVSPRAKRDSSGSGGITPDATDQFGEVAVPDQTDFAPSAVPETPPLREEVPVQQTAQATPLADLFKVKDIGIQTEIDPYTGQLRPHRQGRVYG